MAAEPIRRLPNSTPATPCSTTEKRCRRLVTIARSCSPTISSAVLRLSFSIIPRRWYRRVIPPTFFRTAICASRAWVEGGNENDAEPNSGNRSHHIAGHRRRVAFDRRTDGQCPLSDVLFFYHS